MNVLNAIIDKNETIICVGSGGVGKTTTAAVLGLHGALSGKKTLVLTIDPAKRLANSLGLAEIGHHKTRIPVDELLELDEPIEGELWAMMLDMKTAFDELVRRNTDDQETAERIVANRFYYYFSTSLAGAQEYSAVERLAELSQEGSYDLIILDTPPAQHALDFMQAPRHMFEALDNKVLQWFYKPAMASGRFGLKFLALGTRYIRKTIAKFTGSQFLDELAIFIESMMPLLDGVKERAGKVRDILNDPKTVFLVVTTPDPLTIDEAVTLDKRLGSVGVNLGAFVVNRVYRPIAEEGEQLPSADDLAEVLMAIPGARYVGLETISRVARAMLRNAEDFSSLAEIDEKMLTLLDEGNPVPVFPIPFFSTDIYTLKGLERVRRALFGIEQSSTVNFQLSVST